MQKKVTIGSIIFAGILIGVALMASNNSGTELVDTNAEANAEQVVIEDGIQYITILARGGYSPRVTKAKAGMPTVIRMETKNSYDCSIALVIPDIKYQSYLPQTGITEIEIPLEKTQGTLRGTCSMAMYGFQIDFE